MRLSLEVMLTKRMGKDNSPPAEYAPAKPGETDNRDLMASLPQSARGQGRPPLSPVRQSLQDLTLSRESSPEKTALVPISIDSETGMPKQDMNVHCNPLFTEPLAAQLGTGAGHKKELNSIGKGRSSSRHHVAAAESSLTHTDKGSSSQQMAVPPSPPSKLQQSLRALLQQHTDRMEVSLTCMLDMCMAALHAVCI